MNKFTPSIILIGFLKEFSRCNLKFMGKNKTP